MRIKTILNFAVAFFLFMVNYACNDDLTSIGSSMKPKGDSIFIGVDSVYLTARTQQVESIYADASSGFVGEYFDHISGRVKYDYMCQLYVSDSIYFHPKTLDIDSVRVRVFFDADSIIGNKETPMGFSAYKLKEQLTNNHYTNFDVTKYLETAQLLGKTLFRAEDLPTVNGLKYATIDVDPALGREILAKWKADPSFFKDQKVFNEYFAGLYVTSTFGSGSLYPVLETDLFVSYKYTGRNGADTADSTRISYLKLSNAEDLYQMNRAQNEIPPGYISNTPENDATYISSPSGLYTELTLNLKGILDKAGEKRIINSAVFKLMANPEEEMKSGLVPPRDLLMIRKEEVKDFFEKTKDNLKNMGKSKALLRRSGSTNTYNFITLANSSSPNLSEMLNYYLEDYKKDKSKYPNDEVKFMIIPITSKVAPYGQTYVTTSIVNLMRPTFSVLRTMPEHMKLKLVFNEIKPN